jgi:hypothetical protein
MMAATALTNQRTIARDPLHRIGRRSSQEADLQQAPGGTGLCAAATNTAPSLPAAFLTDSLPPEFR